MKFSIGPGESTLPALVAAKQLVINGAYPIVQVIKYITITKSITVTITYSSFGDATEEWSFHDSAINIPTVTEANPIDQYGDYKTTG